MSSKMWGGWCQCRGAWDLERHLETCNTPEEGPSRSSSACLARCRILECTSWGKYRRNRLQHMIPLRGVKMEHEGGERCTKLMCETGIKCEGHSQDAKEAKNKEKSCIGNHYLRNISGSFWTENLRARLTALLWRVNWTIVDEEISVWIRDK